jgi:nucleotide-binding universal stress UspA family protein
MYRSLLVALDGSPFAEQALPLALHIARCAAASLHVVTVGAPEDGELRNYLDGIVVNS